MAFLKNVFSDPISLNRVAMVKRNNSFTCRLLADIPDEITIKCVCHSAAIRAKKPPLMLPKARGLVKQTSNWRTLKKR